MREIRLESVSVTYQDGKETVFALDDFSAVFPKGKISVVLGTSGSGKTTLLRVIAGLQKYQGRVLFDQEDVKEVPTKNRNLSYVNQDYSLYPRMTVFENIAYPLKIEKASVEERKRRVKEIAERLGISFFLTRYPKDLSLGQKQRVALARALIKRPDILLCDEPLANLDSENKRESLLLMKEVIEERGVTTIYVTHHLHEGFLFGERLFLMDQGKLQESGSKEEMSHSNNPLMKELFISSNL